MTTIKRARERAGLSQSQLAAKLGVSQAAVSKWEAGQAIPRTLVARRLARVLKMDVSRIQG